MFCAVNCDSVDRSNTFTFRIDNKHSMKKTCAPPKLLHRQQNHREQKIWCANMIKITTKIFYEPNVKNSFYRWPHSSVKRKAQSHKRISLLSLERYGARNEKENGFIVICHCSQLFDIFFSLFSTFWKTHCVHNKRAQNMKNALLPFTFEMGLV